MYEHKQNIQVLLTDSFTEKEMNCWYESFSEFEIDLNITAKPGSYELVFYGVPDEMLSDVLTSIVLETSQYLISITIDSH